MPSSYPVPSCAVPVSARDDGRGAAGAAGVAAEERQGSGRTGTGPRWSSGGRRRSARAARWCSARWSRSRRRRSGGTGRSGRRAARCITRRWGRWRSGWSRGRAGRHRRDRGRAPLDARFVKGERERLLARAFMIRVIVLMTLMPEARVRGRDRRAGRGPGAGAVGAAVAAGVGAGGRGLAERARPGAPGGAAGRRAAARPGGSTRTGTGGAVTIGRSRPLKAGSLDGTLIRVPDTPANRAVFGSVGTGDDSGPVPERAGAAADLLLRAGPCSRCRTAPPGRTRPPPSRRCSTRPWSSSPTCSRRAGSG